MWYIYFSTTKGRARCEQVIEDMYATGDLCESEPYKITKGAGKWWHIYLKGN